MSGINTTKCGECETQDWCVSGDTDNDSSESKFVESVFWAKILRFDAFHLISQQNFIVLDVVFT